MPLTWHGRHFYTGQVRIGSNTAYTQFDSNGRQTTVGTAGVYKDLWIPATDWYGIDTQWSNAYNANATAAGSSGIVVPYGANFGKDSGSTVQMPVLAASAATNTDSRAATSFIAPSDAATTGSVQATLYFTSKVAMATTGSMEVFRLRYQYLGSGSPNLTNSGSILYGGSYVGTGNGVIEAWDLGDLPSFNYSASPLVMLELALEQSNSCCMSGSAEEHLFGLRLSYYSDAQGAQSL